MIKKHEAKEQYRLIQDLIACRFEYAEVEDYAKAYNVAFSKWLELENSGPEAVAWMACYTAIGSLATMRFNLADWIKALGNEQLPENLKVAE